MKPSKSCEKSKMVEQDGLLHSKLCCRMAEFVIFNFFIRKYETIYRRIIISRKKIRKKHFTPLQNSCQTFLLINKDSIYLKSSYKIIEEFKFEDLQIYLISDLSLQRRIEIAIQSQIPNFHQSYQKKSCFQEYEKYQ